VLVRSAYEHATRWNTKGIPSRATAADCRRPGMDPCPPCKRRGPADIAGGSAEGVVGVNVGIVAR
jgi:hypothetical protein